MSADVTALAPRSGASQAEVRAKLLELERVILAAPQGGWETFHHFAPGVYLREVRIKAGHVVTGAIHKKAHLNILAAGEIAVWTEDGMRRVKAPAVIPSQPGIKRAGYAISDTVWMTVCHNPDDLKDVPALEERYTAKSFEELEKYLAAQEAPKQITEGI